MQILRVTSDGQHSSYIWHSGDFIPTLCYIVRAESNGRVSFETPSLRNADLGDLDAVIELLQECRREAERIVNEPHNTLGFLTPAEAETWLADYRARVAQEDIAAAHATFGTTTGLGAILHLGEAE